MYKLKILAVDDESEILEIIENSLKENFEILKAYNGNEALNKIKKEIPDLLILDYMLPDIDGVEICKILRKDPLWMHLPILMLTGKGEIDDKIKGLESGADDYMVKPFSPKELLARVKMLIKRSTINLDANPLTHLPGNVSIYREIEDRLKKNEKFAVLYIDINNFKALNDYYGFARGDNVIKDTARIIINAVQEKGNPSDFIGHIGGDDFIVISTIEKAEDIAKKIIFDFDKNSINFFDEKDRKKGYIEAIGRDKQLYKFGFPTIAIGIVTNLNKEFNHVAEISSIGAELKSFAKKFNISKYIIDKRN